MYKNMGRLLDLDLLPSFTCAQLLACYLQVCRPSPPPLSPPQPVAQSSLWRHCVDFCSPQLPFCLERGRWSHGKFCSSADDGQLPPFSLSSWLTFLSSTFFCTQSCFSLLFLHMTDLVLPSCPFPTSITQHPSALYLRGQASACLCKPLSNTLLSILP